MARTPFHPTPDQIELPMLLECLSDPTRLAIVYALASHESETGRAEVVCGTFRTLGTKSNLSYHFGRLREAGLIQTRVDGTSHYQRLRLKDLHSRFPGLIDSILSMVRRDADRLELPTLEFSALEDEAPQRTPRRASGQ
jgi:DNA-binding transcriptional ArsR family regulator